MPEQNFEQQARDMAEQFSMEPQEAVWQRVEAAIAQPKRKRRVIFWWLLPLAMAGGAIMLFTGNKKSTQTITHSYAKKNENKESKKSTKSLPDKINNELLKQSEKTKFKGKEVRNTSDLSYQKTHSNEVNREIINATSDVKKPVHSELFFKEKKDLLTTDNISVDSSLQASNNTEKKSFDTTINVKKLEAFTSDSSSQKKDTAKQIITKKKPKEKPWHVGVIAETGFSSWGNNPFETKAIPSFFTSIPQSSWDNFSTGAGTGRISTSSHHTEKGDYLSIGAAVQKQASKKIFFGAQLTYRYQPFRVTEILRKDTTITTPQSATSGSVYYTLNEIQRFHFINVNANIGWQFIQGKKSSIALEAGLENGFLLALSNKNNSSTPQSDSLKSMSTAKNFYRWQPSVNTAVDINFYTGKTSFLQLSPMMRFGLHKLDKTSATFKENHLTSAGLRIIYFFK